MVPGPLSDSFPPITHSTYSTASLLSLKQAKHTPAQALAISSAINSPPDSYMARFRTLLSMAQLKYHLSESIFWAILSKIVLLITLYPLFLQHLSLSDILLPIC